MAFHKPFSSLKRLFLLVNLIVYCQGGGGACLMSTSCCVIRRASRTICKLSSLSSPKLDSLKRLGCCTGRVCLLGRGTKRGTGLKGMKGGALPGGLEMLLSTCIIAPTQCFHLWFWSYAFLVAMFKGPCMILRHSFGELGGHTRRI